MRLRLAPVLVFSAILFASGARRVRAQVGGAPLPELSADHLSADFKTGEAIYEGHAVAVFGSIRLTADEVRFNRKARSVTARGHAILQQGDARLLAQEITYLLDTRSYAVTDVRFGRAPLYVSAASVEGTPQELRFLDATLTYGEPDPWAPTLSAAALTYYPDRQRLQAEGGRLGLGAWTLLPLPSTPLPTTIPFVDDLTFRGGYTGRLGAHLLLGAKVPLNDALSVGADAGLYTKRGVMIGPTLSYRTGTANATSGFTRGELTSGYIHDFGKRLTDIEGAPIPADRGFITWTHRQRFLENLTLNAQLNYWSDSEVMRDFRPRDFFPVQVPDSFVDLDYTTANVVYGAFVRAQPNPFHEVRQRLPELTFDLLPTPVSDLGLIEEAHASIAVLRDDPPGSGSPATESKRVDLYYAIQQPWSPRPWFVFDPVAGARVTHYADALGGRSNYTRVLGEFGFDSELRASATFDYKNERWGIDGLRHLVTPKLSYRYIPDATKGTPYIPVIDRDVFDTYLEPLSLGSRRQIDRISPTNTLRFEIDQRLQTRDPQYGSRDLARLDVAMDANFDHASGDRTLSALHTELHLAPAAWLDLAVYHRVTPADWKMRELNTALTIHSADHWSARLATHYLEGSIQEYIADLSYRFNEVWTGYTRHHFDSRRSRFVEQTYGMRQTLGNRWQVGYEISFFEGPRRESDFGFNLVLDALRF